MRGGVDYLYTCVEIWFCKDGLKRFGYGRSQDTANIYSGFKIIKVGILWYFDIVVSEIGTILMEVHKNP